MTYFLTVFDKSGEKLLDEQVEAGSDEEGKAKALTILTEKEYEEHTHRLVSQDARLVLFHR